MSHKFFNYKDAKEFSEKYSWLTSFGRYENGANAYDILFTVIAPLKQLWNVKKEMDLNGDDNEKALIDLNLIHENLRVLMVAEDKQGKFLIEDMYDYLLITSQLR